MEEKIELKPCPFCDAAMEEHPKYPGEWRHAYRAEERCVAAGIVIYLSDTKWVDAWNRRSSPSRERVEVLEEALLSLLGEHLHFCDYFVEADHKAIAAARAALKLSFEG